MRVRVIQRFKLTGQRWYIQKKYWWWPVWIDVDYWDNEEVALKKAEMVKRPKIVEVV